MPNIHRQTVAPSTFHSSTRSSVLLATVLSRLSGLAVDLPTYGSEGFSLEPRGTYISQPGVVLRLVDDCSLSHNLERRERPSLVSVASPTSRQSRANRTSGSRYKPSTIATCILALVLTIQRHGAYSQLGSSSQDSSHRRLCRIVCRKADHKGCLPANHPV